jgi:hypothetical protein
MGWAEYIVCMGEMKNPHRILVEKNEALKDPERTTVCVNVRIILKWVLKKLGVKVWTGFMWLRKGTSDRFL